MDFIQYILIALLAVQIFLSGFIPVGIGLVVWTVIWVPIAFVINLVLTDPVSYLGFWSVLWNWESSTWADLIHANIGAGLATLKALASRNVATSPDSSSESESEQPTKGSSNS